MKFSTVFLLALFGTASAASLDTTSCWTTTSNPTTALTAGSGLNCYKGGDGNNSLTTTSREVGCGTLKLTCGPNDSRNASGPGECAADGPGSVHYRYLAYDVLADCKSVEYLINTFSAGGTSNIVLTSCNTNACNTPIAMPAITNYTGSFTINGVTPLQIMAADTNGTVAGAILAALNLGPSFPITLTYANASNATTGRRLLAATTATYTLPLQSGVATAVQAAAPSLTATTLTTVFTTNLGLSGASVSSVATVTASSPSTSLASPSTSGDRTAFTAFASILVAALAALAM